MKPDQSNDADPDLGNLSFEEALRLLDETVQALEAGGLSLADATQTYERGMKLARACNEMLASAELRVTQIRTAFGEQMSMLEDQEADTPSDGPPC
ncbi:MAG: exodeoxyribonuclease VII small subunit [Chloroflexi bacterium]|nr:exodeoxyribonuclease VII small subunit [Chloroflexota bacterium]